MLLGSHVSIAGGIELAPERAAKVGCEVLQVFTRSPRGGAAPRLTPELIWGFKANCQQNKIVESYIHAPYIINLASKNPRIRWGSIGILKEELERGTQLGMKYLMTHLGSAKDYGREKSVEKVIRAIIHVLENYQGTTQFLLEQSAGAGGQNGIIGGDLKELGFILKSVNLRVRRSFSEGGNLKSENSVGICIDTCHAFAMGYDLRDKKAVDEFVKKLDQIIGLKHLKLLHFNDSKFGFGEHKDRHEHIGQGQIGQNGFAAMINHPKLKHLNAILETPKDKNGKLDIMNLQLLKSLRA